MAKNIVRTKSPAFDGNNEIAFDQNSSDIQKLIKANAIYDRFDNDWYHKFTRFGIIDPYNTITTTKEYIFITKPDLCLLNMGGQSVSAPLMTNPFFIDAINRYREVAYQLQSSIGIGGPFINILSNSVSSSLDLPGLSADMIETGGNTMGTKISYRGTSHKSDEDFDFNLEFEDTKYLDVYMLFKMWDEYEKLKWSGQLDLTKATSTRWQNYIINKVLHDQVSIYKFIVGEDGYRIIYYARLTGCIPNSVPRDAFSDTSGGGPQKLTVGWKAHFVRDMDPIIINHFNLLVGHTSTYRATWLRDILPGGYISGADLPLYNTDTHSMEGMWASTPYIDIRTVNDTKHGTHREYFLRWKA